MNAQVAQKICNKTLFWGFWGFRVCLLSYHHQSCLNLLFYAETTNFCIFLVSVTIRHNSEAVPIQLVEKYAKKKLLTKTKISKFLCAWCSTILKIFETTLYTHKVFVATILACYNFLAQLQGCSKWAYCIFCTFFFKKKICCTQKAQHKIFFIIFWKSVWRSQNFFLSP